MKSIARVTGIANQTTAVVICAAGIFVKRFSVSMPVHADDWIEATIHDYADVAEDLFATQWDTDEVLEVIGDVEGFQVKLGRKSE